MANKIAALLVICLVFIAAVPQTTAVSEDYKKCYMGCIATCETHIIGFDRCELTCDGACQKKEAVVRIARKFLGFGIFGFGMEAPAPAPLAAAPAPAPQASS